MSARLVAIVHLGRSPGKGGGRRRVESWTDIFGAAGAETVVVSLLGQSPVGLPNAVPRDLLDLVRGRVVPEVAAWSLRSVRRELQRINPDVIVLNAARAYRPGMADLAPTVVLDFIDRLSVSYEQRAATVASPLRRVGYRALAPFHRRFEESSATSGLVKVAAGWEDASALGATWVPITCRPNQSIDTSAADHDMVFIGTLSYPPNLEALERLSRLWPSLIAKRPTTSLLVAGASPPPRALELVRRHGWTLVADFAQVTDVLSRARLAVAPLVHSAGVQIKVLEAAAHGLPQVVTPPALAGFRPGFPATVAGDDDGFVEAVVNMLADGDHRDREGSAARAYVGEHYSAAAWSGWATRLLAGDDPLP